MQHSPSNPAPASPDPKGKGLSSSLNPKALIQRLWRWLFVKSASRIRWTETSSCSGRFTRVHDGENWEVTLIFRNKKEPDFYSREELLVLLRALRANETVQQWQIPEPLASELDEEVARICCRKATR